MIKIPSRYKAEPVQDAEVIKEMGLAPISNPVPAVVQNATPTDSRNDAVNSLLAEAYKKASQLDLTEKQIAALTADFDDSCFQRGAGGDANLIYLEHKSLRDRLNQVVGIGKWNNIVRRSWSEEFTLPPKPPSKTPTTACRVYIESVLIVKGCYVGEAVGDGTYYKSNAKGNFGDAYESAKTSAFRRCCKDFGIGLQAFSKDFCEAWKEKYKGFERPK